MKKNRLGIVTAVLGLGALAHSQQQPGVLIQTETRLVLVDSVVTDKKGEYIRDLTAKDFKVWEDNKEQTIKSFSFEAAPNSPMANQKRYLVLFFDNSTIAPGDQIRAREAAGKFIDANAGANRMIAIVNFSGALQIAQNFTDDRDRLKQVVAGVKISSVAPNQTASGGVPVQLSQTIAGFGARDLILSLRALAKNLGSIPGRKTLVLLSGGMPLTPELISEVTATLDVCNRSNVAIYPIDIRGLVAPNVVAPRPRASLMQLLGQAVKPVGLSPANLGFGFQRGGPVGGGTGGNPGGGGVSGGRGGGPGGPPASGGTRGAPSAPGNPGRTGNVGNPGNTGNAGRGGTPTGGGVLPPRMAPYNQSRDLIPKFPESVTTNQQVLFMLAEGTGGFVIHDTNDLLGGLEKIGKEQNEYYILGYTPPESAEGACHVLRVKVDRSGASVRARTGYCNAKSHDLLSGNALEKQLEARLAATQTGAIPASMQLPYFYTSPGIARVNVTLDIASDAVKFEKQKGKFHADLNVLGIAATPDGAVGARFSDIVKLDFPDKKQVEQFQEKPLHYENQFDVAAGNYTLKVVFSSGGSDFGKVEMSLPIDPYDGSQFAMSGLALSKQFLRVSDAGLGLDAALIEDKTPLIANGVEVIPAGSPQFHKGEPALFYFELYEPLLAAPDPRNPPAVVVRERILDRQSGEAKEDTGPLR
ncbi:MAG: VWA domain-containing protein, partial [Acidobacteriia bacterium]|nr:VWA domain-containing protein [Terriglobia bacterium]